MHFVAWYWDYTYEGKYHSEYKEETGLDATLGLLLTGGFDIPVSERVSMPIMARVDGLMRYGMLLTFSVSIGLTFR
jgi:hypothetical protein